MGILFVVATGVSSSCLISSGSVFPSIADSFNSVLSRFAVSEAIFALFSSLLIYGFAPVHRVVIPISTPALLLIC